MKTKLQPLPTATIEEFADEHGLEMSVKERKRPEGDPMRYYASFEHAEIKDGSLLISASGDGATPEDAIRDYAKRISMQRLVIDSYQPSRREIEVPRLTL